MADTLAELSSWKMRALAAEIESNHLRNRCKDTKENEMQSKMATTNKIQSDIILGKKKMLNNQNLNYTQQCVSVPEFKMPDVNAPPTARIHGNVRKGSPKHKRPKGKRKTKKRKSAKKTVEHSSSSETDEPRKSRGKNDGQVLHTKRNRQRNAAIKSTLQIKLPPIQPPKH